MPPAKKPSAFTDDQLKILANQVQADRALKRIIQQRPALAFIPHDAGQLQALCSDHIYRHLIPGNGWGKTTCMAVDADMLMQRDDPYKPHVIPDRPTTAIWCCKKFQQFTIMQPKLNAHLTRGFVYNKNDHFYTWPNASRLFVLSGDSQWDQIQGIEIDAVYFDEHPDQGLWTELLFRRRGNSKTRYMVAATMTEGLTWYTELVVKAVEQWHAERGRTNADALAINDHPTSFIWNRGGIKDNPSMTQADEDHYRSITTLSDKLLEVRLSGGYADVSGDSVFDGAKLTVMATRVAKPIGGSLLVKLPGAGGEKALTEAITEKLPADRAAYSWVEGLAVDGGRITIFEYPDENFRGNYIGGLDFAAGLVGKDYDAGVFVRKTKDGRAIQVAEVMGHWGDVFFAQLVFALATWYYGAFLVGERQFGLPCMRRLYDEMGYGWMYYRRLDNTRGRRMSDELGHHRTAGDTIIPYHRLAISREEVQFNSLDCIMQHKRYQFRPRKSGDTMDDVTRSADLVTGAPAGEFDDLVMASAYAMLGVREISYYPPPAPTYAVGSFGQVMDLERELNPKRKQKDPYSMR